MKLLAPFITMICLAFLFASAGIVHSLESETAYLWTAYLPAFEILIVSGLGISVIWFAVWVLLK